MAEPVRNWRLAKPSTHTREVVKRELPADAVSLLRAMAEEISALKSQLAVERHRVDSILNAVKDAADTP